MKNNKAMNLSQLAANGTALDLLVAEVQGEAKVKKLRTRHARKGETLGRGQAGGRPVADGSRPTGAYVACNGGWAANGQVGYGAQQVSDLDAVKAKYTRVKNSERAEYVREQAAILRAEREAKAYAALDELLADL